MAWLRRNLIAIIGILVLVYLFVPIAVVAILSFNKPDGKFNVAWNQFSLDAWQNLCGVPGVCQSFVMSIQIGVLATLGIVIGTNGERRRDGLDADRGGLESFGPGASLAIT